MFLEDVLYFSLCTTPVALAILKVLYVVYLGFFLEILLLAFMSSMMMGFAMKWLRRAHTSF